MSNHIDMLKVNLWDQEFKHSLSAMGFDGCCLNIPPTKIQYIRNQTVWDGVSVFTNNSLDDVMKVDSPIKIAWMVEARAILPKSFERLLQLEDKFDYILTWYEDLLEKNPAKYKRIVTGSTRIMEPDRKIYPKTNLCSLLTSNQRTTEAHRFRHFLAEQIKANTNITIFGSSYTPFPTKLDAHKDFMFSIVIMNSCENFFFTEYLIDCFMCGTIPVFYGCPKIGEFFNTDGIIHFTELMDIFKIIPTLTPELYASKREAIEDNFQRAHKYICTDDMLADVINDILTKKLV